ncbi:MAG: class I SAM-dependent RNA methyltransferase [Pseudomonadota bacterium]
MSDDPDSVIVERLDGDGMGRAGGLILPATLPGERVLPRGGGGTPRIIMPSPERVRARCVHAGPCGGCTLQHAADDTVARFKTRRLVDALAAHGIEAETRPIVTVPERSRRRIALAARRTKGGTLIGHRRRGSEEIVPLDDCLVARPALVDAIGALPPLVIRLASRSRLLRLTLTEAPAGIDAAIEGAKPPGAALRADLAGLARGAGLARLALLDGPAGGVLEEITLTPPLQPMGPGHVLPPPGAFLQPSRDGAEVLTAAVQEALGLATDGPDRQRERGRRIVDLFAGIGTFALPLSTKAEVLAVELGKPALGALDRGWREAAPRAGLARLTTESRNLFRRPLTVNELAPFAGAVIDPPFAGAESQMRCLAASSVPRIASVSCNPVTFARDAAILVEGGYTLDWVQPVDQFRWSAHLEIVAAFARR